MMNCKRINPPKCLHEFIDICRKTGYLDAVVTNQCLKNIKFLPLAELLREKIVKEWNDLEKRSKSNIKIYSDKDIPEIKPSAGFLEKHKEILRLYNPDTSVPFGFSEIHQEKKDVLCGSPENEKEVTVELGAGGRKLVGLYSVAEEQDMEYFYNIQRQRKLWWMKYASNPGRFSISEVRDEKVRNYKVLSVSLYSNYSFGSLQLENIQLLPWKCFQTKIFNAKTEPDFPNKIVKTSALLEIATIETIINAIDAGDYGELSLNRRLAPFQCSFYCLTQDASTMNDLKDLAKFLSLMLQKHEISTMDLTQSLFTSKSDLELKYLHDDSIGVPYGILLESDSLVSGFINLRNRDTTLFEKVHISQFESYLLKIFSS